MSALQHAGQKPDVFIRKAATHMNTNMAQIRLHQESTASVSSHTNAHIKCLRAAFLLLKTLQLLLAIKVKDQQLQKAFGALCKAVLATSGEASARLSSSSGAYLTQGEQQESKLMLLRLVKMALPVMKQLLKSKMLSMTFLQEWSCGVMSNLLAYNSPSTLHAVAAEVISSGGIPIMMLVLGSGRASAMRAFAVFHTLLSDKMPREQVEAAESVLVSLQAVPRLCNLLPPDLPGWIGDEKQDVQKNEWLLRCGQQQLGEVCLAAHMINKLLKRDLPPSDPLKALPTPTPVVWEGIQHAMDLVLKCGAFYNSIETTLALTPAEVGLRNLQAQLTLMPYILVAGHLPNLELDVSKVMRTCMKRVIWLGDSQRLSDGPYVELLQAFLSRLARDPSVLTLTSEEIKGNKEGISRHKVTGAVCQGCPSCNGPSWHFKTESVAAIWTICCAVCGEQASHPVAAVAVNALYTALADPEQCKHLLLHTHTVVGGSPRCDTKGGFDVAMRGLKGQLTSRLTLGACLARACTEEIQRAGKGVAAKTPWFTKAVREGTFKMVYTVIQLAIVAPLPWDEERCVALARAIMSINKVCVAAPADVAEPTLRQRDWGYVVIAAELLAKLRKMTGRAAAQRSLLEAALAILTTADSWLPLLIHEKAVAQDLATRLVDLLVSPNHQLLDSSVPCWPSKGASFEGWGDDPIHVLQPRMLYLVQRCMHGQEASMYFSRRAVPLVPLWFENQVRLMMQAGGAMAAGHGKLEGQLLNLKPYTDVLEKYSMWQAEHDSASEGVPNTILLALHAVVKFLVRKQDELMLLRERRSPKEFHRDWLACEANAAQYKSLVDSMLGSYEHMRQDPFWMPVITAMKEGSWCSGGAKFAARFKAELATVARSASKCIMSANVIRRLQACFSPLVVDQLTNKEASAMSAYNQLMAEEEEAAAKAAAKKAKKQKQKAKKQQAQQVESSADVQAPAASETQLLPSDSATELRLESSEGLHERNVPAVIDVGTEPRSDIVTPQQSPDMRPVHVTAALTPHSPDDRQGGGDQACLSMPATGVTPPPHPGHDRQGGGDQMVPRKGPGNDKKFLQNLLCCPITRVVMREPVIAADGHTYERAAIEACLLHNTTSPVTRENLAHMRLVPNILIRGLIIERGQ
ncbi:TPA: hypothetical protein ACH3X1_010733 [Trebouxia sp. C0004]